MSLLIHAAQQQRVVVAVPPPLAARIRWEPALLALHDQLFQRLPMGTLIKVEPVYDEPFGGPTPAACRSTSRARW